MAQYYVIRNKNTGLYFRGKGVNRWGKHYNQASIYRVKAMAEHTIKEVSWRGEQAEIVPIQIIETSADVFCMAFKNKADVVPKSEVEVLYTKIIHLEEDYGSLFANYLKAKSEVAREIFEDLEMYVEEHNGCSVNLSRCEFADLKKKYTGGKHD